MKVLRNIAFILLAVALLTGFAPVLAQDDDAPIFCLEESPDSTDSYSTYSWYGEIHIDGEMSGAFYRVSRVLDGSTCVAFVTVDMTNIGSFDGNSYYNPNFNSSTAYGAGVTELVLTLEGDTVLLFGDEKFAQVLGIAGMNGDTEYHFSLSEDGAALELTKVRFPNGRNFLPDPEQDPILLTFESQTEH